MANLFPAQGEISICTGCDHASNVMFKSRLNKCCPDSNYKLCKHVNTILKIVEAAATCETTVLLCTDCQTEISEFKTDCI